MYYLFISAASNERAFCSEFLKLLSFNFQVLVFIMAVREGRKLLPAIPVVQDSVPQTLDINAPKDKTPKLIQDLKRSTQEYALMAEL